MIRSHSFSLPRASSCQTLIIADGRTKEEAFQGSLLRSLTRSKTLPGASQGIARQALRVVGPCVSLHWQDTHVAPCCHLCVAPWWLRKFSF